MTTLGGHGIAAAAIQALRLKERRQSERHSMDLLGRVKFEDGREEVCHTWDVSVSGLEIRDVRPGPVGSKVTCFFGELGWVDGEIRRHTSAGFGMAFKGSPERLARIASRVEWLAKHRNEGATEHRQAPRIVPTRTEISFTAGDGTHGGTIIDLSRSGAAIASPLRLATGSAVTVGMRRATVVREVENGFAVEFKLPLSASQFDHNVVL